MTNGEDLTKDASETEAHTTGTSKSPVTLYAPLFEEIAKLIHPDEEEASKSLALLHDLSQRSFSEIPPDHRPKLRTAIQSLARPTRLPSSQAAAALNFLKQFDQMCERYDTDVANMGSALRFFSAKESALESLKRLHKRQVRITNRIAAIREEEALGKRLMGLDKSELELKEEYGAVGKEAVAVKWKWDQLITKNAEMVEVREKAEMDKSKAERSWMSFISLFKSV